ncbi:pupal cuticle protein Edg-78E-like [Leguminivora glycinivorella]|uniref:pupal cuticle protein Edg-78E-like n=1 Tax=Leguminivora glycinivorella TaxID=1035111 RepID=UPI00200F5757|nr:pupal cuticle protein Edg-78E-like [Leguminivora glycinivorella]
MKYLVLAAFIGLVGLIEAGPRYPGIADSALVRQKHHAAIPPTEIPSLAGGRRVPTRAVATNDQEATVLRFDSEVKSDAYQYVYETSNGISAQASGSLQKGPEGEAIAVQGQYQYAAPDGTRVEVSYVADDTGYHPTGDVIPTPHPIPAYIARSLEYIAAHPQPVEKRL